MRIIIKGTFDNLYTRESGEKDLIVDIKPDHYEIQIGEELIIIMKTDLGMRFPKL